MKARAAQQDESNGEQTGNKQVAPKGKHQGWKRIRPAQVTDEDAGERPKHSAGQRDDVAARIG